MKPQKVFVRYKNFNDNSQQNRQRQVKKPNHDKKKYAEKTNKIREPLRQIIESFQPIAQIPQNIANLIKHFPKFFTKESKVPEKDSNQYLNQFIIHHKPKKFVQNYYRDTKKQEPASSSDPDWNSDDEIDSNLESQKIDDALVQKVVEKYGDKLVKKQQILKKHQKQFLQDYFRTKRVQQAQQTIINPVKQQAKTTKEIQKNESLSKEEKQEQKVNEKFKNNIWSQYQQKQVNNFVDLGFMTKIQDNDEEQIEAQLAQDDGMFLQDEDEVDKEVEKKAQSSEQSDGDDIFGDDQSTTIKNNYKTQTKQAQNQKQAQGIVYINDLIFSKIAEEVGLLPSRCAWIIRNQRQKYKVTTQYMDTIYRKEKMNVMFPLISLNHSEFVYNDQIDQSRSIQIFRKFNARRKNNYFENQKRPNYVAKNYKKQFKEKLIHNKNK